MSCPLQSYSGLRGAVAFSLALSRVNEEPSLLTTTDPNLQAEFALRKSMFTAVTVLVLFTVFVQVRRGGGGEREREWRERKRRMGREGRREGRTDICRSKLPK